MTKLQQYSTLTMTGKKNENIRRPKITQNYEYRPSRRRRLGRPLTL